MPLKNRQNKQTDFLLYIVDGKMDQTNIQICINNCQIGEVASIKFLGITIDANLNWKKYTASLVSSISRNIGILHKVRNSLSESSLMILYNAFVQSHLDYCIVVWGKSSDTNLDKLLDLQKKL